LFCLTVPSIALFGDKQERDPPSQWQLFEQIDSQIDSYRTREWKASLPFQGFLCSPCDVVPAPGDVAYNQKVDLFVDGASNAVLKKFIIRFDPGEYPVNHEENWKENCGGHSLITAICAVSNKSSGCSLLSTGGKDKGSKKKRYIYCQSSRLYDSNSIARKAKKADKPQPSGPLRKVSFHGNRNNSRGQQGKLMAKRTTTSRPLCADDTCKVIN
jgi:hypothetical protein